jgi:hypothetical protein
MAGLRELLMPRGLLVPQTSRDQPPGHMPVNAVGGYTALRTSKA